ncbi:MAG: family 10 glycosylhydrolase [Clostridia bacterium]|nr:family 10 glycosylhydrolase [Clostridia bacterium]
MLKELFNKNKTVFITSCVSIVFVVAIIVVMGVVYFLRNGNQQNIPNDTSSIMDDTADINGVWIASVFNINFPSQADLGKEALKAEIDEIIQNTKKTGLNAIYFQVRPESDALYKSDIFPPSRYMSSNDEMTFDALDYIVKRAHKEDIKVHAWINPVRVSSKSSVTIESLADSNPAKMNPDYVVKYGDGKMYYNLGIPEVRELICEGVAEIVENYEVDGIVFDDYFYPYPSYYEDEETGERKIAEFDDRSTYEKYNNKSIDITDWRRENVNILVNDVYNVVKSIDNECLFGVSPFGIWKNGYGDESGSLSSGIESYYSLYCDSVAWINGGYIDYIAPQIYWTDETASAPYDKICDWWADRVSGTKVRLLISHGAYRYENDWESPSGIMTSQVQYASQKSFYKGSLFYGYKAIADNINNISDELIDLYISKD